MVQAEVAIVPEVLEAPDYRRRAHRLRRHRSACTPTHVAEFLQHAEGAMRSDPAQARQCARLAVYLARSLDDVEALVRSLRVLTQAATLIGRYPEALRAVDEALARSRPDSPRRATAELQAMRVQVLTQLERWPEAREVGARVLETFEALGDTGGIIRIRLVLADLATQLERPREALRHFRQAEWLLPEQAPPRLRAAIAANRANALQACNRFRAAARWFHVARAIYEDEGCEHTTAQMDYNLAYAAVLRGRFDEALRRFDEVESVFERLRDDMHRAHIDLDRAEAHLLLHLPEDARGYAERAAERFADLGLTRDRAQAEYFAGRAAALGGELQAAAERYAVAREAFAALGMRGREIGCLVQQAYVRQRMERPGPARVLAREAEALLDEFANPLTVASVGVLQAHLDLAAGQAASADARARTVLASTRRIFAPWLQIEARRVLGQALGQRGRTEEAIEVLREAVATLERQRVGVPPDEYMTAYGDANMGLYLTLVSLLVEVGAVEEAFAYAQRAKARALLDTMVGERREVVVHGLHATRIQTLRESLHAIYWELLRIGGGSDLESADARCLAHERAEALERELEILLRRSGHGAGACAPAPVPTVDELQAGLPAGTVLVEYLQTETGIVAFTLTREALHATVTRVEPAEVEERVQRLRFHLAKHERPMIMGEELVMRATRDNLGRLATWLVEPIAEQLRGGRLVVAPHGHLQGVPFHALPAGDGWLLDRFEIVYAPSAAVWLHCTRRATQAAGDAAVFALPDGLAPQIEAEAHGIAGLLGTRRIFLGDEATLANLREAAADAPIVHVASHGMFRRNHPGLSALRLADGWIAKADVETLAVHGALVVLSTCESGVAGVSRGNEILGVARGFLHAGARALLCSQWRVRDDVTAAFMQAFYRALGTGADAASAHRHAMTTVRRTHAHPYYWAPFFLMGAPTDTQGSPAGCLEGNDR